MLFIINYYGQFEHKSEKVMNIDVDILKPALLVITVHLVTGCAVAQPCVNGDTSFLWEPRVTF